MSSYQYRDPHVKDKMVSWPSYRSHGNPHTWERRSVYWIRAQFYQTRSAWSKDQGSTKKRSAIHNFVPTVTKFCVLWEGLSFPHDTKFGNCRGEIVDRRVIFIWSLILGLSWSCLIKVGPGPSRLTPLILQGQLFDNTYHIMAGSQFCSMFGQEISNPSIYDKLTLWEW